MYYLLRNKYNLQVAETNDINMIDAPTVIPITQENIKDIIGQIEYYLDRNYNALNNMMKNNLAELPGNCIKKSIEEDKNILKTLKQIENKYADGN